MIPYCKASYSKKFMLCQLYTVMGRKKDLYWKHVEELDGDRFKCIYCGRVFSGGIPRIVAHLAGATNHGIDICFEVPAQIRKEAYSKLDNRRKKAKIAISSSDLQDSQVISASPQKLSDGTHQNVEFSNADETDKNEVDEKLIKFIISNNIPFDVIETQSFTDLMRSASKCPDYRPPGPLTVFTKIIANIEMESKVCSGIQTNEVLTYIDNVKGSWATTGCTLRLEKLCNFVYVTAYSPEGSLFMNCCGNSLHTETDFDITRIVCSIIEDIGVDQVVQLITNDASISHSAGEMLTIKYPKIFSTQCVAQRIHGFLKDVYHKVEWVQLLIQKSELIIGHLNEDATILQLMPRLKFKRPCKSKFASYYQMLQSIFDEQLLLQQLVYFLDSFHLNYKKDAVTQKIFDIIQSAEFWSEGQELLETMKSVIRVLCLVECYGSTSGYLYEAMEMAKEAIKAQCIKNQNKYAEILDLFTSLSNNIIHPMHLAAAFLNPVYMNSREFEVDPQMERGIVFMLDTLVGNEEKEIFKGEVKLYLKKVPNLFTVAANQLLQTCHPCIWWELRGKCLPVLRKCAMRILSQPCKCSLPYNAYNVVQEEMKKGANFSKHILILRMNMMLMEKWRTSETEPLEPIDLERCSKLPDYTDPIKGCEDDHQMGMSLDRKNFDDKNAANEGQGLHSNAMSPFSSYGLCRWKGNIARRRWRIIYCLLKFLSLYKNLGKQHRREGFFFAQGLHSNAMSPFSSYGWCRWNGHVARRRWRTIYCLFKFLSLYNNFGKQHRKEGFFFALDVHSNDISPFASYGWCRWNENVARRRWRIIYCLFKFLSLYNNLGKQHRRKRSPCLLALDFPMPLNKENFDDENSTKKRSGSTSPVTEEETRAFLLQNERVTTVDLVARFRSRLKGSEHKMAFLEILRRISRIRKTGGSSYVVLRDGRPSLLPAVADNLMELQMQPSM
ncbi:uncharacterized protein LOC110644061 isoform X2 [Hevea brasiliensis]|uniref:uncharacterized protein LOC110644061 isoform X2 n=1 Tax=Hevea brasiliensis TaxID=3981 RepID=UPI0025E6FE76|nr:uncharacterized protein LOC110644061 isoform X2 [Hevea brasiliensis]